MKLYTYRGREVALLFVECMYLRVRNSHTIEILFYDCHDVLLLL